ncbi:MAG: hypothetical protein BLITH_1132 [Brockia lithotrophica]|uniref:Uncharacterized protein n=1 Tax=Brockia lithotrophica TaxID=933949 RepID=A0A2T5G7K2_9BACL|nr:MAG: hypothetical protein BLITH_1132 [Brockia lithotrophica]
MEEEEFWQAVDALVGAVLSTQAWKDFSRAVKRAGREAPLPFPLARLRRPVDELLRSVEEELREVFADDPFRVRGEGRGTCTTCTASTAKPQPGDSSLEFFVPRNI